MLDDTDGKFDASNDGGPYGKRTKAAPNGLAAFGRDLKKSLQNSAQGPLIVAPKVMALAEEWDKHSDSVEGATIDQWLRKIGGEGKGIHWYSRRAKAVSIIGEHARRSWHHEAAVWACEKLSATALRKLEYQLMVDRPNGPPKNRGETIAVARSLKLWRPARPLNRDCAKCNEMREKIREMEALLKGKASG